MAATKITYSYNDGLGVIQLVPPEGKPPTIDGAVLDELESIIEQLSAEANLRVVLVKSAAAKYFCVGANIGVLEQTNEKTIVPWVMEGHRVLNMLEDLPVPVVAVVQGYAMGGGLELAMACDLIFAADTAKLAQSEAGLGFIPGWGGTRRLASRIGAAKAKYYFYSGKMIGAEKALEIGLVDFVGQSDELQTEIDDFCSAVIGNNRNALSQFKTILKAQEKGERDENAAAEAFHSISCLKDPDAKTRLHNFLNKRK